jgi:hypothetical protein
MESKGIERGYYEVSIYPFLVSVNKIPPQGLSPYVGEVRSPNDRRAV